ncbi:MAG: hypothetical protein ACD_79C00650G0015, partial [uncultured bacterium]
MSQTKKFKWEFIKDSEYPGEFFVKNANRIGRLYFPLFNMQGFMSAITPELKGDIKTSQNSFLLEPQSTDTLPQTKVSRNFWIKTSNNKVWSIPGNSAEDMALKAKSYSSGNTDVMAAPGYFSVLRENKTLKLSSKIEVFVPSSGEPVEVSIVTITNKGNEQVKFTPISATPMYCRSADNLRDHRQVTHLLSRVAKFSNGIQVTPVMSFDERGHKKGTITYTAYGFSQAGKPLAGIVADHETFIGEGGNLEAPELIYSKVEFKDTLECLDGRQVVGALKYDETVLNPNESASFVVVLGIHNMDSDINSVLEKFNSVEKAKASLIETRKYWNTQVSRLIFKTGDPLFDNWMIWVSLQPVMRRVYGCSFLPDFDYGRGGRGWRDLWQDCLGILLTNPQDARELLLNNIQGVRIDGSNATIIGTRPGEFIADRNNIPRTWMDHGVWPLITINLYIEQTGDLEILLEKRPFFFDGFSHRCKKVNRIPKMDNWLKLPDGKKFTSHVFVHLLTQTITQFYNRGDNGNIKLEDADWNDGLDMAGEKGESVPFTAAYAGNLETLSNLCALLFQKGITGIDLPEELNFLIFGQSLNTFKTPSDYRENARKYFDMVEAGISGKFVTVDMNALSGKLKEYSGSLKAQVSENEFIKADTHEYFNGYYNNDGKRVEGMIENVPQMSLTGQVFPIMSGTATIEQCKKAFKAAKNLLKEKVHGGFRLNTNFNKMMLNVGRAYSFSYGDKENGSFFSHMNVMFANGLYKRGLVKEAYEVINSIYKMASNTQKSLIFPCIPEYFSRFGRGMYCYITGSASWLVMTLLVE